MLDRGGIVRNRLGRCEAPSAGVVSELLADVTEGVPRGVVGEIRGLSGRSSKIPPVSQPVVQPDLQTVRPGRVAEWARVRRVQTTRAGDCLSQAGGGIAEGLWKIVARKPLATVRRGLTGEHRGEHEIHPDHVLDNAVDIPLLAGCRCRPLIGTDVVDQRGDCHK